MNGVHGEAAPRARQTHGPRAFAEFFAGIGLVRMGLERQGWRVAFANDIDEDKREMYEGHFGPADYYDTTDVHKLAPDAVPAVTLAAASFPCTDLSVAGAMRGLSAGQSSAFWGFVDVLRRMGDRRPPVVQLENVVGFLKSHKGRDFRDAMLALNGLGYSVDPFVLDAAHFVPQSRPRLFVICTLDGVDAQAHLPRAPLLPSTLRPEPLISFIQSHPDIRWSLRSLPEPPPKGTVKLPAILENLDDDAPEWWSRERAEYLINQMSARHRAIADAMIEKRRWSYGTVFRRVRKGRSMGELRTDGIAGCLRTPRGGSGRQILFKAGYGRYMARLLTPNECARLMGADGYRVAVPLNQALFGFGDAVCVSAVAWIAEHYLNPLTDAVFSRSGVVARVTA